MFKIVKITRHLYKTIFSILKEEITNLMCFSGMLVQVKV